MNRYLNDNFAPVHEERTAFDLDVTGEIPAHLDGRYLRIGPNPPTDPGDRYHWFLGEGMVHGVRLAEGRAQWYRNRYVRAVGDDFPPNTNVLEHGGRTLAIVEAGGQPYALTHELDTVGPCDLGTITGGYTAHPHEDPATGELHGVSYSWTRGNLVDYSVVGVDGRVRHQVEIEVTGSPMIHDCALTEHYLVVYDLPVTFDLGMVADILIDDEANVVVDLVPTSPTCPMTDRLEYSAELATEGMVNSLTINWLWLEVWTPARLTEEGREQLRAFGLNI